MSKRNRPADSSKRLLAALCAAAGPVCAQQAPDAPPAAAPAAAASTPAADLEPVVISGSGVARRAFDTPYAVDIVDAAQLRNGGLMVNLSEALAAVPGLTVNMRNNYAQDLQINSRGFGARSTFGVRGLRLYTDGIPASMPDGSGAVSHFDLAGAQRIEVLRGPFSALYGNSSGGVISLVSSSPKEPLAEVDGDIGSNGVRQVRLSAETPLGNGWDIRLQGSHFETDGFRPQSEAKRDLANLRVGWRGELDTITILLNSIDQPAQDPLGLTRAQFDADPEQTAPQATQFDTRKNLKQTQIGAQWMHRLSSFGPLQDSILTVYRGQRSVTQWQAIPVATQTASPLNPGAVIDFDRDYYGADERLVWRWDNAQVIAGASIDQLDEKRRGYENFIGTPPDQQLGVTGRLRRQEANTVRTVDAYTQGSIDFTPQYSGTLGIRTGVMNVHSHDEFLSNGDDSGSLRYTYTNPVAALQWHVSPALNVYLSAGRGFESPTLTELAYRPNGQAGLNTALSPQSSGQLELGAKWRDNAHGLGLDAAIFRANTDDEIGVQTNTAGRSTYQNVGRTKRQGVEISTRWQATKTVRTLLALTWLDAKYKDGFLTCTSTPCVAPTVQVPAGNRIAGTAAKSAYAEVAWQALTSAIGSTEFAVEMRAQGNVPVNDLNSDFSSGVATYALRASQTVSIGAGKLELLARLDNVADRQYAGSVIVNDTNGRYFEPAAGRTVLVSARWKMGF